MHGYIQMAAAYPLTYQLANARLEGLETVRHAQMQIQKAVIYAPNCYAQTPAIFYRTSLGVTGHGL
jgi:hypothetical protein